MFYHLHNHNIQHCSYHKQENFCTSNSSIFMIKSEMFLDFMYIHITCTFKTCLHKMVCVHIYKHAHTIVLCIFLPYSWWFDSSILCQNNTLKNIYSLNQIFIFSLFILLSLKDSVNICIILNICFSLIFFPPYPEQGYKKKRHFCPKNLFIFFQFIKLKCALLQ